MSSLYVVMLHNIVHLPMQRFKSQPILMTTEIRRDWMTMKKAAISIKSSQLKIRIKNNENSMRVIVSCRHRCNGLTSAFNFFVSLFFSKALDRSVKSFSFLNIFANNLAKTTISRSTSWLTSKGKMDFRYRCHRSEKLTQSPRFSWCKEKLIPSRGRT